MMSRWNLLCVVSVLIGITGCPPPPPPEPPKLSPPEKPGHLSAIQEEKSVKLSWSYVSADGFYVWRSVNDSAYEKIAECGKNLSYVDATVELDKNYCYKVMAFNNGGETFGDEVTCIFVEKPPVSPKLIACFTTTTEIDNNNLPHQKAQVTLEWEGVPANEDVLVIKKYNSEDEWRGLFSRKESNQATDNIVGFGKKYWYKIQYINDPWGVIYSNEVEIFTGFNAGEEVGSWPASNGGRRVVIAKPYIYVASSKMIFVYEDALEQKMVKRLSHYIVPKKIQNFDHYNGYLYILGWENRPSWERLKDDFILEIVDVRNPQLPKFSSRINLPYSYYYPKKIVASGDRVYVVSGDLLLVLDVSQTSQPKIASTIEISGISDISIEEDELYITKGKDGLSVFNISNPAIPVEIASYSLGSVWDIETDYGKAFVLGRKSPDNVGLFILDITDPANIHEISYTSLGEDSLDSMQVADGYIFLRKNEINEAVVVVDVGADLKNPKVVHKSKYIYGITDVKASYPYLFVANINYGVGIWDYSQLQKNNEAEYVTNIGLPSEPWTTFIQDNYCYVADYYDGLFIFDVTDPTVPVEVGVYPMYGQAYGGSPSHSVFVKDDYAYVPSGPVGLRIINVKDKSNPFEEPLSNYDRGDSWYRGVYVKDDLAYIAHSGLSLLILDVKKRPPALVGECKLPAGDWSVLVEGNRAYVSGGFNSKGFSIVDVSDPEHPNLLKTIDDIGSVDAFTIKSGLAYIPTLYGLQIIDVSTPEQPQKIGLWPECLWGRGIAVVDNIVYISDGISMNDDRGGIWTIDVSDPRNPKTIGLFPAQTNGLTIVNNLLYITSSDAALKILRFEPTETLECRD